MKPLTPRQIEVLATIREAGVCRITVRKTLRQPGSHGRWRMVRPQLSDEPTAYRAECDGRRLPIRTVHSLLCRGELVPLRRGWSLCVRLRARDPRPLPASDQIPAATGERREASCDPATRRGFGDKPAKRARIYPLCPLGAVSSSVLQGFAEHAPDTSGGAGDRTILRRPVRSALRRRAELVLNSVLYGLEQFACPIFVDTAQRTREVNVGVAHERESQTRRGFIRDRHHVSHGVFLIRHAPQTYAAIYAQSNIVKLGQNKSISNYVLSSAARILNLKQSLRGARLLVRSPHLQRSALLPASGEGAAA